MRAPQRGTHEDRDRARRARKHQFGNHQHQQPSQQQAGATHPIGRDPCRVSHQRVEHTQHNQHEGREGQP